MAHEVDPELLLLDHVPVGVFEQVSYGPATQRYVVTWLHSAFENCVHPNYFALLQEIVIAKCHDFELENHILETDWDSQSNFVVLLSSFN